VLTSIVVVAELMYGVERSTRREASLVVEDWYSP
jgi:predicted nucleic acid-binding protein